MLYIIYVSRYKYIHFLFIYCQLNHVLLSKPKTTRAWGQNIPNEKLKIKNLDLEVFSIFNHGIFSISNNMIRF